MARRAVTSFARMSVPIRRKVASDTSSFPLELAVLAGGRIPENHPGQTHVGRGVPARRAGYDQGTEREQRSGEGCRMPQQAWSEKRERQYQHIKEGLREQGRSEDTAEEIAARTVTRNGPALGRPGRRVVPPSRTSRRDAVVGCDRIEDPEDAPTVSSTKRRRIVGSTGAPGCRRRSSSELSRDGADRVMGQHGRTGSAAQDPEVTS